MMVNPVPKVSVCVPTFNGAATVKETLASILAQRYHDFEVVVSDNASQDATLDIVRQFDDGRVRIEVSPVNLGAEGNFARCIELARGQYTAIFHADDVYDPDILGKTVRYLDAHPEAGAVFTEATLIDEGGRVLGARVTPLRLLIDERQGSFTLLPVFRAILRHHNFLITPSAVVRSSLYRAIKPFDGSQFGSSADLDTWLQILSRAPIGILREPLVSYRLSSAQGSAQLIRLRTDRADFFKVLDAYIGRFDIERSLTRQDRQNYRWLEQADRVARALATLEGNRSGDLSPLLSGLFTAREAVESVWRRPRIAICYLIAMVLRLNGRPIAPQRLNYAIRLLRQLAKI